MVTLCLCHLASKGNHSLVLLFGMSSRSIPCNIVKGIVNKGFLAFDQGIRIHDPEDKDW